MSYSRILAIVMLFGMLFYISNTVYADETDSSSQTFFQKIYSPIDDTIDTVSNEILSLFSQSPSTGTQTTETPTNTNTNTNTAQDYQNFKTLVQKHLQAIESRLTGIPTSTTLQDYLTQSFTTLKKEIVATGVLSGNFQTGIDVAKTAAIRGDLNAYSNITTLGNITGDGKLVIYKDATFGENAYISGKLGLGTATVNEKLNVVGNELLGGDLKFTGGVQYIVNDSGNDIIFGDSDTGDIAFAQAGKVGIGTAAPQALLDIVKTNDGSLTNFLKLTTVGGVSPNTGEYISFYDTSTETGRIEHAIESGSLAGLRFYTYAGGLNERMRINGLGNVGIGTTAPSALLEVSTTNSSGKSQLVKLTNTSTSAGSGEYLSYYSGNTEVGRIENASDTSTLTSLRLYTYGGGLNERLRISGVGNVGIGTSNPQQKLDINGALYLESFVPSTTTNSLYNDSGVLKWNGTALATGTAGISITGSANFIPYLVNSTTLGNSNIVYMSDKIGIGTTNPSYTVDINGMLHVSSSTILGSSLSVAGNSTFDSGSLYIDSSTHRVGIGTTAPTSSFDLWKTGTVPMETIKNTNTSTAVGSGLYNSYYAGSSEVGRIEEGVDSATTTSLRFYTFNSQLGERMRILGNGNVGIGTTRPTLGPLQMGSGAYVTSGGVWTNASDKNLKTNFIDVDPDAILKSIVNLPIYKWNYKNEPSSIQHIGPTAQDFYGLFQLGGSDTSISTIDPAGISLVAMKALDNKLNRLSNKINLEATAAALQLSPVPASPQVAGVSTDQEEKTTFSKPSFFTNLMTFLSNAVFKGSVIFQSQPLFEQGAIFARNPEFNNSLAGYAIIAKGTNKVDITFDQEYSKPPITNVSLLDFNNLGNDYRKSVFNENYQYIISNVTTKGFSIELNKPAQIDMQLSWTALPVSGAKTYSSSGQNAVYNPTPSAIPTSQPAPTTSPSSSVSPSPTNTPAPEAIVSPAPTTTTPQVSPTTTIEITATPTPTP